MNAIKTAARKIIDSLPEDTSYDEILKELVFDRMIKNGLQDSQENQIISNQEMSDRIKKWQPLIRHKKPSFGVRCSMWRRDERTY